MRRGEAEGSTRAEYGRACHIQRSWRGPLERICAPDRGPRSAEAERREDGRESARAGDSPHGAHQVGLGLQVSGGGGVGSLLRLEHFDDHLDAVEGCQKGGAKFA